MTEPSFPTTAYSGGRGDPVPRHLRNPRHAYDRDGRECHPMDLANASQNGVKSLWAIGPPPCRHEGEVPLD